MERAREAGDSAAARFAGSTLLFLFEILGLAPRLYATTCFAGSGLRGGGGAEAFDDFVAEGAGVVFDGGLVEG